YAGAMLLHAFLAQAGAGTVLAAAAGGPGDALLLSAVSVSFALGAATTEQFKHLAAAGAGPLAGLAITPAAKNARIPALQKKITRARTTLAAATAARKPIPAK